MEAAALAGIVVGGLLFAAGLVVSNVWLLALGLVVLPVALILGLLGGRVARGDSAE